MNSPEFSQMSDEQLRAYVLAHRQNVDAFYTYVDRMRQKPPLAVLGLDDPLPRALIERLEQQSRRFRPPTEDSGS